MGTETKINEQREVYLHDVEVAKIVRRGTQTLRNDRSKRRGIPYIKLNRSVRYSLSDVLAYCEAHRIDPEART